MESCKKVDIEVKVEVEVKVKVKGPTLNLQ
jgi:hypothetical protein